MASRCLAAIQRKHLWIFAMPKLAVIANASCLIVLDKVDALHLLPALYESIWVTQAIADQQPMSPTTQLLFNLSHRGHSSSSMRSDYFCFMFLLAFHLGRTVNLLSYEYQNFVFIDR